MCLALQFPYDLLFETGSLGVFSDETSSKGVLIVLGTYTEEPALGELAMKILDPLSLIVIFPSQQQEI